MLDTIKESSPICHAQGLIDPLLLKTTLSMNLPWLAPIQYKAMRKSTLPLATIAYTLTSKRNGMATYWNLNTLKPHLRADPPSVFGFDRCTLRHSTLEQHNCCLYMALEISQDTTFCSSTPRVPTVLQLLHFPGAIVVTPAEPPEYFFILPRPSSASLVNRRTTTL